jgi:hypothetical protein
MSPKLLYKKKKRDGPMPNKTAINSNLLPITAASREQKAFIGSPKAKPIA